MEEELPCLSHLDGCPTECLQSKKVIFYLENDEHKVKMKWIDAMEILPYPNDIQVPPPEADGDMDHEVKAPHIYKDIFFRLIALVMTNRKRSFPPQPFGLDNGENLVLNKTDMDIFCQMSPDNVIKLIQCCLFFDQYNMARLCAIYMCDKYFKDQSIANIQETFNLPVNLLPSDLYLGVIGKYGLCFDPNKECFNVENTAGDLSNFNGITCSGICELENSVLCRFGIADED